MAWYDEAVFYHIYPLGLTGAPKRNDYGEPVHRLRSLLPWIDHIASIGCTALYIGPLFESGSHGYDTTDYRKLDSRLGTNDDLTEFVAACHQKGMHVIFDGVFNHTGRDFFAFRDLKEHREASRYRDWYVDVNFSGNNEYNDGFSYGNWGGYNLLARLNQRNPEVQDYICDVIRFWVREFDVDGIRLDAADVLDFDFMHRLRMTADEVKPDFWLMGEVIHGEYGRWVNDTHLHSVTNYQLHKALYSGHNDHNYFEIAHTVRRFTGDGAQCPAGKLYNFVDNHDVERIYTKLSNKAHFVPVHILLYTLPGIPSVYYGSEFGIEGEKRPGGPDDAIRPALKLDDYRDAVKTNPCTALIAALGALRKTEKVLACGDYRELTLTTTQFAFARSFGGRQVLVTVNNGDSEASFDLPAGSASRYDGALFGGKAAASDGRLRVTVGANSGEVWVPADGESPRIDTDALVSLEDSMRKKAEKEQAEARAKEEALEAAAGSSSVSGKPYEEMTVEELQAAILAKMRKNGPVTDEMKRTVFENVYHDSLVNWVKSFR